MTNVTLIVQRFLSVCLAVVVSLMSVTSPALAENSGNLVFYEGNNCTQDIVFTYNSEVAADGRCPANDEARSLLITGFTKPGAKVKVYDSLSANTTNDYAIIDILSDLPPEGVCVNTFEKSVTRPGFKINYVSNNGLDGKISHVTVEP